MKWILIGYNFNEYEEINLSDNNIECLRYWPSDVEIDNAISTGYERAIHLARYLEMTAIPNDAHYFNIHKRFLTSQLEDFWRIIQILEQQMTNLTWIVHLFLNV